MDYKKKYFKWKEALEKGDKDIEGLYLTAHKCVFVDNHGLQTPDTIYFCMMQDGQRCAEYCWVRGVTQAPYPEYRFMIKKSEKIIFAKQGSEKVDFFGFGFQMPGKDQKILLYIRIKDGASMLFSDAKSDTVSDMFGARVDNLSVLDSIIDFMVENKTGDTFEEKEAEDSHERSMENQ